MSAAHRGWSRARLSTRARVIVDDRPWARRAMAIVRDEWRSCRVLTLGVGARDAILSRGGERGRACRAWVMRGARDAV